MRDEIAVRASAGSRVTLVGVLVNTALIGIKLAAGFMGNSQALIADAVHSVSDLFTDAVVLAGLKLGARAPDADHPFGHARLETMASAIVGVALLGAAVFIGYDAVKCLLGNKINHLGPMAIVGAGVSIGAKEGLYWYTVRVGRRINSPAVTANAWHHRSDAMSSVAVLIGVTGAMIHPQWHFLDGAAALVVSLFIVKVGLTVLWESVREFTDTAPETSVVNEITSCAMNVPGVEGVHDIKVRLSGGWYQMEIHVVVDGDMTVRDGHAIAKEVEQCLARDVGNVNTIIVHVDPSEDGKTNAAE
jgi:cation diffusion facilitator family transporter